MTDQDARPASEVPFGEALSELEGIVASLESGTLGLEESLDRYERGVALLRSLQSRLSDAQQRVTVLLGELEAETTDEAASPEGDEI